MSGNETFLERFIENIGTIPLEIRRNLAHMRCLDQSYLSLHQMLRESEEEYLKRAHDIVSNFPVQSRKRMKSGEISISDELTRTCTGGKDDHSSTTTTATTSTLTARDTKNACENQESDGNASTSESASSQDSRRDDGQFWIKHKEGITVKVPLLPPSTSVSSTSEARQIQLAISNEETEQDDDHTNSQGTDIDTDNQQSKIKFKTMLVVPTTEELRHQIQDPNALLQIAIMRRNARELVEEKLSNAIQTHAIVDDTIKRLDADIEQFEALLKTTGQYVYETMAATVVAAGGGGGPQPNDLAAIQVTLNSPDWILAKVIDHDEETGMYNLDDEDIESCKTFLLPESQVVILGGVDRLNRGDVIYGVYPDTTSFYQATVVEMPKKVPGKDALVLVHFKDDGDEKGITHAKAVPMKHVMKVPYGAIQ